MLPSAQNAKIEAFYDLTELKRLNFNSCVTSAGI